MAKEKSQGHCFISFISKRFALVDMVEAGNDRVMADYAVIDYFRKTYAIWLPGGKIDNDFGRMTRLFDTSLNRPSSVSMRLALMK